MSFFGFEDNDLEQEKRRFIGGLQENEDLAVYTWGEESYDGLGDALQEGGDELNDETFGGAGDVGKDFNFSSQNVHAFPPGKAEFKPTPASEAIEQLTHQSKVQNDAAQLNKIPPTHQSLESIWNDKSPFSVLPRANGAGRLTEHSRTSSSKSPFGGLASTDHRIGSQQPVSHGSGQAGVRTLQEIEAEMRANAQQSRASQRQQQEQLLEQQQMQQLQQLQLQQQKQLRQQLHERELKQQQEQLRIQQLHQLQQRTSSPRLLPQSQSPRFHLHQQQILLLQQEQERQQQQRLQALQEQLHLEELERQFRAHQIQQHIQQNANLTDQRHPNVPEMLPTPTLQQRRTQSPASTDPHTSHLSSKSAQYLQLQQRLLSQMAQAEFMQNMQGITPAEQEALRAEAMRKIMETERMEEKRRRKAAKIAHMSRYNDLMTQSDKDFITRIQVSQLVTQDPYAEDFYAQVYGAIMRSRLGLQSQDERVLKFGSGGGVGLGLAQKGGHRRQSAMQKMEAQVERIVNSARMREKEKGLHSLHSLQGALGKTSGRSYKAAPRQLLQVESSNTTSPGANPHISKEDASRPDGDGAAREAAKLGREALGEAAGDVNVTKRDPLSQRQILMILEGLYDQVLQVEQLRRDSPPEQDSEAFQYWEVSYNDLVDEMWIGLGVMVPVDTSDPHPFVSLLSPIKGKKILPRLSRHLSNTKMLTLLTLLVACFHQLDVVRLAPYLDSLEDTPERQEIDRQTLAFLGSVMQSVIPVVAKAELRLVTGLLGLLLDRSDILLVAQTRPGLALLTLFMSRVEVIKQTVSSVSDPSELPTPDEAQQWQLMFDHLFQLLASHLPTLFPSTRIEASPTQRQTIGASDIIDQPVWQFLAALALHASTEQQQFLVASLREKVLENVASAHKGWVAEDERQTKLANVNLFLHALGLDSSQIAV